LNEAGLLAERVCHSVGNTPIEIPSALLTITISVGVIMLTDAMPGIDDMLSRADLAMYKAKRLGGNRVMLHEDIVEASQPATHTEKLHENSH